MSAVLAAVVFAPLASCMEPGIGLDGDGGVDEGLGVAPESVNFSEVGNATLAVGADAGDDLVVGRVAPLPERREEPPVLFLRLREHGDVGEYLDPDAHYLLSPPGGSVVDVGEFQDPEHDDPTPLPYEGVSEVGDYLLPEEGP